MTRLPAIPRPGRLTPAQVDQLTTAIIAWAKTAQSLEDVVEAQARAAALETYLERHDPVHAQQMRWAGRQLDKRVGQLLPAWTQADGRPKKSERARTYSAVAEDDRTAFRRMARYEKAWDPWSPDFGAASRRAVLRVIDEYQEQTGDVKRETRLRQEAARRRPGTATVVLADALDWLDGQPRASADLLLTDPPYSTEIADIDLFARKWLPAALDCLAPHGRAYITIGAYPQELLAYLAPLALLVDWVVADVLVWTFRNTLGPSGRGYMPNWHAILHIVGPETPAPTFADLADRFSVFDISAPDGRHAGRLHAWEKPPELADRLLCHAGPVERVIDPFAGTGTFLEAAARAGATAAGCDADPAMVALCEARGVHRHGPTSPARSRAQPKSL